MLPFSPVRNPIVLQLVNLLTRTSHLSSYCLPVLPTFCSVLLLLLQLRKLGKRQNLPCEVGFTLYGVRRKRGIDQKDYRLQIPCPDLDTQGFFCSYCCHTARVLDLLAWRSLPYDCAKHLHRQHVQPLFKPLVKQPLTNARRHHDDP